MPLLIIAGIVVILAALYGPSLWARRVLSAYAHPRADFPGTGGELARHLLDLLGLQSVKIEYADEGDHYDPLDKAVRLAPEHLDGTSLTAVVVAAHEVGHAMQDRDGYAPLAARTRMAMTVRVIEKVGAWIMLAAPVLGFATASPGLGIAMVGAGIVTMASRVVFHLITLPVEFDASFGRALPMLRHGGYLPAGDMGPAHRILRACALTYVASSLSSLLNLFYWLRVLR